MKEIFALRETLVSVYYDTEDVNHEFPSTVVESVIEDYDGLYASKEYLQEYLDKKYLNTENPNIKKVEDETGLMYYDCDNQLEYRYQFIRRTL